MTTRNHLGVLVPLFLFALSCIALLAGCSDEEDATVVCVDGRVAACACPNGGMGTQACQSDGTWGACACLGGPADTSGGDATSDASTTSDTRDVETMQDSAAADVLDATSADTSSADTSPGTTGDTQQNTEMDTADSRDTGDAGMDASDVLTTIDACINPSDAEIHQQRDVGAEANRCGRDCILSGTPDSELEQCTVDCLRSDTGLGLSCATCYGQYVVCNKENCFAECLDPANPDCATCRENSGCNASFEACSGLSAP